MRVQSSYWLAYMLLDLHTNVNTVNPTFEMIVFLFLSVVIQTFLELQVMAGPGAYVSFWNGVVRSKGLETTGLHHPDSTKCGDPLHFVVRFLNGLDQWSLKGVNYPWG